MNRQGFSSLFDASVFIAIIMIVASMLYVHDDVPDTSFDASDVMDSVIYAKMKVSDVTALDDPTILPLTDLLAYSMLTSDEGPVTYVRHIIETYVPGHLFMLVLTMDGVSMTFGDPGGTAYSSSERSVSLSTGGELGLSLRIY